MHLSGSTPAASADKACAVHDGQASRGMLDLWIAGFEAARLQHNNASLTSLVQALGYTHQIEPMLQLLAGPRQWAPAVRPDANTFNAAIAACSRLGQQKAALQVQVCCPDLALGRVSLDIRQGSVHAPHGLHSCPHLIWSCFMLLLQADMQAQGVPPDVHTYTTLISGCAYSKNPQLADTLFQAMQGAWQ